MNTVTHFTPPAIMAIKNAVLSLIQEPNSFFWVLFGFRYVRLIVHIISYLIFYKATPIPARPTYHRSDCTVVVPTVDPGNKDFDECLYSILTNAPAALIIVTVGKSNERKCESAIEAFRTSFPATQISVLTTDIASKRNQVCAAIPHVKTKITLLVDDHVFWPSPNFVPAVLAPFEDPAVGCVGTKKLVRRERNGIARSFFNFLGCVYLARHNFELTATNAIDGGVFVVSGRTSIIRTEVIHDPSFMQGFTNEMFFFGKFGPLNADDDNFITRWLVKNGWKIKFQNSKDATIETTLGTYPKFLSQCLRWVRTTWRSNSASLFTDGAVWFAQPWCVYAVYITSFFNFALFYDAALLYTLYFHTSFGQVDTAMYVMGAWIFASKMVKLIPHFARYPADIVFIPGYILFAYYHSLLKLYALLTFYVTAWGGRNLAAVGKEDVPESEGAQKELDILAEWARRGSKHVSFEDEELIDAPSSRSSTTPRSVIETPWGLVRRINPSLQPANVLESLIFADSRREVKCDETSATASNASSSWEVYYSDGSSNVVKKNSLPRTRKQSPDPVQRNWVRGGDCGRQHEGKCMLDAYGRCKIWNVEDVQWSGK